MTSARGGRLARAALAGMLLLLAAAATAATAPPPAVRPAPVTLRDAQERLDAEALGRVWIDRAGDATIEAVASAAGAARFEPARPQAIHSLGDDAVLWVQLRLARGRAERLGWIIAFPMPVLDRVTVFQPDGSRWRAETAGDTLPVASWPEAGRHPFFRLDLPAGQLRDVYLRIRHSTSANVPIQLLTERAHNQRVQVEYLALGLNFGALLLLIALCLGQSWVYRDRVYAWYALYAGVTALAVAAYTGVAPHLLWPGFGMLADAPQAMLSYFAAASALLFVRNLIGIAGRFSSHGVHLLGIAGLVLGVLHPALPKLDALALMGGYVILASFINVAIALAAWRRGDVVGLWVSAAYVPLAAAVVMGVVRMFGWLPVSFGTQYAVVLAMALEVPLLLVALSIRSRERHGAEIREQALSTHDALTGLLAPHLFHDRLRQVVARLRRGGGNAAVLYLDLVNYPRIQQQYGSAVAEQSLLRTVIKLRRLLRDVDTASRIGEARFAVILEGVDSRAAITDRAARLIAAGLMPLQGLKPEVTLQFHMAAAVLEERTMEAAELGDALSELLGSMSPRTRRPIRFLQPPETRPAPMPDSVIDDRQPLAPEHRPFAVVK